jgi:signal transduction histidine kinase
VSPKLVIRSRAYGDRVIRLGTESLTIGRGTDQDVSIADRKISSAHAVLECRNGRWLLRDLGSTNGTYVNGLQVAEKSLDLEDEIIVGNTTLVFTEKDQLEPLPTPDEAVSPFPPIAGLPTAGAEVDMEAPQTVKFRLTDVQRELLTGSSASRKENAGAIAQRRLQVLYNLTDALRGVTSVPLLLERVMDFIFEVVDADRGFILMRDPKGDGFVPSVVRRRSGSGIGAPDPPGVRAAFSTGLIREAIEAGEAVITRDAQQDDRFQANQSIYLYGIRSAITVPLNSRDKILGVVHLDKRDARRPFDEEDLHVLVIVCTQAASALANAELIGEITDANRNLEQAKIEIERWNRELEKKVEERTLEVQSQAERIAELAKQKDELLGMVAHDLRTPLTGLLGFSEIALQGLSSNAPTERVREDLEVIRATAVEMNDLLSDLLDVSKIEAGKLAIDPVATDLGELVEDSRRRYVLWADSKKIDFRIQVVGALPKVALDPRRIQQVLNNLVSNAIKFSSRGDTVTLAIASADTAVEISVTDTGQGIAPEDAARLFARFEQGSSKATRGEHGTGLGLAIAKKIVELHGGRIWVDSKKGVGSRFAFSLPLS